MRNPLPFKSGGVEVGTAWATLKSLTVPKAAYEKMWCEVASAATGSTLSDFRIRVKAHRDGSYVTLLDGTDFDDTSLEALLFCTDAGPHELPVSSVAAFRAKVAGPAAMQLQAKAVGSTSTVTVRGNLYNE